MSEKQNRVATGGGRLSVRAKCRIIEGLAMLTTTPGIAVLVHEGMPAWSLIVVFATFWFSGMLFVVAMIGDGKDGLGFKQTGHRNSGGHQDSDSGAR